jgi:hypothetical protein
MSTLRKRQLDQPTEPDDDSAPLNLARVATIDYSSEDPAHPVEHLVDEHTGPGGSYWAAAQADTTEQLVLAFDQPQSVTRLVYEVGGDGARAHAGGARRSLDGRGPQLPPGPGAGVHVQPARGDLAAGKSPP